MCVTLLKEIGCCLDFSLFQNIFDTHKAFYAVFRIYFQTRKFFFHKRGWRIESMAV